MEPHVLKFFQFLEDKDNKNVPLRVKLLNPNTYKITKDDLNVKGNLDLSNTNIKELPAALQVERDFNLSGCTSLESIPNGLQVGWSLSLSNCPSLKSLPNGFKISRGLYLSWCTSLKTLPNDLQVGWSLDLADCTLLKTLPNNLKVGDNLYLDRTPLAKMYSVDEIRAMIEATGGYVNGHIYV